MIKVVFSEAPIALLRLTGELEVIETLERGLRPMGFDIYKVSCPYEHYTKDALVSKLIYYSSSVIDTCVSYYCNEFRKLEPDMVVAWSEMGNVSAVRAAQLSKIPVFVPIQGVWHICPKMDLFNMLTEGPCSGPGINCGPCFMRLKKITPIPGFAISPMLNEKIKKVKRVLQDAYLVPASKYLMNLMTNLGYRPTGMSLIYNGIDVQKIKPVYPNKEGVKTVLYMAPLHRARGFEDFIRLAKYVKPRFPDVRFLWVGQNMIQAPEFETKGWVYDRDELRELYEKAYMVLFLPIRPEPMGMTLLNAMAHGKPVVAYDTGGVGEAVIHGECGYLAPLRDLKLLIQHIEKLLKDEALAEELGRNSRRRVELYFNSRTFCERYAELLNCASSLKKRYVRNIVGSFKI